MEPVQPGRRACRRVRELRPYQSFGIDRIASKAAKGIKRIIFQLATGGGKTITFAGLVNRYLVKHHHKVVILVHREELLRQAHRALFDWYEISAAPITANTTYIPNVNVYVCMVETANNRLKKNAKAFGDVGLLIVDECHIGNFKKLYDYFPESLIIGFTATPISATKKDPLKNYFEDIVCGIDIPDLIKQKSLAPNKTYHIQNVNRGDLKVKNGEFDESQMASVFSSSRHVQNCLKAYKDFAEGTKTIIFNCNIEHSKKVTETFLKFGYDCRHLDGESDPRYRQQTLKWFHETPNAIMNNVGILTTGFDEPGVLTVIVNKATLSLPLWLQMTGRGSRPYQDKDHFRIIDMGGNAVTHGDWCAERDWSDIFFNPDKPKTGGEAPSKECKQCSIVIHASQITCPHCGFENRKKVEYDNDVVKISLLKSIRPIQLNVTEIISDYATKKKADGTPYKDNAAIHAMKLKIINHVTRVWRVKHMDERIAHEIIGIYQDHVKEWCRQKDKPFDNWMFNRTSEWMYQEFERVFKWNPTKVNV